MAKEPFRARPTAPKDVLNYWNARSVNIVASFDHRDVFAAEHVQAFTAAKVMRLDVATDIRDAVGRAIKEGRTFRDFAKDLEPELVKKGWWGRKEMTDPVTGERKIVQLGSPRRLKTIYQSNVRSARAAGFWARAQRTKRALPFLVYELGPSENHRTLHVAQQGKVYPVDHVYWNYWLSPNGWGCKCWQRQISRAEAESMGGVSPEPDLDLRDYFNKRTGETIKVPNGIDPGWHINPGRAHADFVSGGKKMSGSIQSAVLSADGLLNDRELRSAIAGRYFETPAYRNVLARGVQFNETPQRDIPADIGRLAAPIAVMNNEMVQRLKSEQPLVQLSVATVAKQENFKARRAKSLEDGRRDYSLLQTMLEYGVAISGQSTNAGATTWSIFHQVDGKWYRAVLKVLADKQTTYLTSLHRTKPDVVEKALK